MIEHTDVFKKTQTVSSSRFTIGGTAGSALRRDDRQLATNRKRCLSLNLPIIEYGEAWDLQHKLVAARKDRVIDSDVVLFLEHHPVFTMGRRGGLNNLKVTEISLKQAGIPVIQVERGGDITYHGPGQLVVYPILDLEEWRLGVSEYVTKLEETMIRAAADWGIKAGRNPLNRGVWVGNKKMGSVGITIRKGVSFHGIAFNINVDLTPFGWINPCGLKGIGATSIKQELSYAVSMHEAREVVKSHMEAVFQIEFEVTKLPALPAVLETPG
jgi:lipoate-protein ligase B